MQKGKENVPMGAASSCEENTRRKKAFGRSRDVLSFLYETPKTMIFYVTSILLLFSITLMQQYRVQLSKNFYLPLP